MAKRRRRWWLRPKRHYEPPHLGRLNVWWPHRGLEKPMTVREIKKLERFERALAVWIREAMLDQAVVGVLKSIGCTDEELGLDAT